MRRIQLSTLVLLGATERFLFYVTEGWMIHGERRIVSNIDRLLAKLRI